MNIHAKCYDCNYEGKDFKYNESSGFIICPKCKTRKKL